MDALSTRDRLQKLAGSLKKERSTWDDHWRELDQYCRPRRSRFLQSDTNRGSKVNSSIYSSAPLRSLRTCGAGMAAGISSPARPWFRLGTRDPQQAEVYGTRLWLHGVEELHRYVFARSNYYNCMAALYPDLALFGTQALWSDEDPDDFVTFSVLPVGSFCLARDSRGKVTTITREFSLTSLAAIGTFGRDKVSSTIRDAYDRSDYASTFTFQHVVEPNRERQAGGLGPSSKRWSSYWFEEKSADVPLARVGGYDEFPAFCPRWSVLGEDAYGWGPGMDALPDCKEAHTLAKHKLNLVDKATHPPMVGPSALRDQRVNLGAGAITYLDNPGGTQQLVPAVTIHPDAIEQTRLALMEAENRIREHFFADLWLMISDSDRRQITAEEIRARQEEKMLMLGPVLEGLHRELHSPAIDRVFGILWRRGAIPEPPEQLQGGDLSVEYVSILAQAQRAVGIGSVERLWSFGAAIAQISPSALQKLNTDELIDEMADRLGVKPSLVRSDEEVAQMREAAAQAEQQKAAADQAQQLAGAARDLGQTPVGGDNALGALLQSGAFGPPGVAP